MRRRSGGWLADQTEPKPRRALLARHRDFRWFWAGETVSVFGTQVTAFALPLVAALTLHAGAGAVGAVATASFLPNVIAPLLAGHLLESRRRRPAMIGADIVRGVVLLFVPLAYAFGFLSIDLLCAVAFVVGAASAYFDVASFAYIPTLVKETDLPGANQAMQGSLTVAQVAGPGLAGIIVQITGPPLAVIVNAVSYLASVAGVATGGRGELRPVPEDTGGSGIFAGVRSLLSNPYLRSLTAHAAMYNVAYQIVTVNLVVWVVKERHAAVGVYGVALAAAGAGAFLGAMGVLRVSRRVGYGRAYLYALVLFTGLPLALAALPLRGDALGYAIAAVEVVAGIGVGAANVLSTTLRQAVVGPGALARSMGSYRVIIFGVIPFGSAIGGVLGETLGSRTGVAIGTVCFAISATPMVFGRVRRLGLPEEARPAARSAPVTAPDLTTQE